MERRFTLSSITEGIDGTEEQDCQQTDIQNEPMLLDHSSSSDIDENVYAYIETADSVSTAKPARFRYPSVCTDSSDHIKQCGDVLKASKNLKRWCITVVVIDVVFFIVGLFIVFFIVMEKPNSNNTPVNIYHGYPSNYFKVFEGSKTKDESDKNSQAESPDRESLTLQIRKEIPNNIQLNCDDIRRKLNGNYAKGENCSLNDVTDAAKLYIDDEIQKWKKGTDNKSQKLARQVCCVNHPVLDMKGEEPFEQNSSNFKSMSKWKISSKQVFTDEDLEKESIRAPKDGVYLIYSKLTVDATGSTIDSMTTQSVQLKRKGAKTFRKTGIHSSEYCNYRKDTNITLPALESIIRLEKGDKIRIVFQNSDGTEPISQNFAMFKI